MMLFFPVVKLSLIFFVNVEDSSEKSQNDNLGT